MQSPIFVGFNEDRSKSGQDDVCINLYPEFTIGPKGPMSNLLITTPGLTAPLVTIGTGPIRGVYVAANDLMYVVSANQLFSVNQFWTATLLGSIFTGTGPVSFIDNPTQLLVVDGISGWMWDKAALTLTSVIPNTDTDCTLPNVAVYQDGFGLVNSAMSNQIYQSNYNDLSKYATLNGTGLGSTANNAYIQGNARNVVTMFDMKREVWIFKSDAVEVWINNGNAGFAFVMLQGIFPATGCLAAASVARLDAGLAWLGGNDDGGRTVYMSVGYQAKPISTFALGQLFQSFVTVSDAIAYSYQSDRHYFYVLTFPTANQTWVYDLASEQWHQRAYFLNGAFSRERANCHTYYNGTHVVGDYQNGNLYAMSDNVYTDNGTRRKWVRSWRALSDDTPRIPMSFDSLQILLETGITAPSGTNPQIMLRWSDDGGYTWTGAFQVPAGKIGETAWRAIQNRLGSTKIQTGLDRVWEISGSDPMQIKITGAEWTGGPA